VGYTAALQSLIEHCRKSNFEAHLPGVPLGHQRSNGHQILDNLVGTEKDLLVPIQIHGTCPPLFLVHSGDGTANGYLELAHELGPAQPVYVLEALGLNGTGQPQNRIEDMAATYLKAIRSRQAKGPYQLGGWSLGGIIAFEMAQQLLAQHEEVRLLAFFDTKLPEGEQGSSATSARAEVVEGLVASLMGQLGLSCAPQLPDNPDDRLVFIVEKAHTDGLLPPEITLSDLQKKADFSAAHLWARRLYKPETYSGKIVLFRATDGIGEVPASDYGWSTAARDGVEVIEVPGTHMSILKGPCARTVASHLRQFLVEAKTLQ
jgi:thioesterase domain-containing protein